MRDDELLLTTLTAYQRMKLAEKEKKGYKDWVDEDLWDLVQWLDREVDELKLALITPREKEEVWREAADVANLAAMIAQKIGR